MSAPSLPVPRPLVHATQLELARLARAVQAAPSPRAALSAPCRATWQLPNDFLSLRVPVWVSDVSWVSEKVLIVGTGYREVRCRLPRTRAPPLCIRTTRTNRGLPPSRKSQNLSSKGFLFSRFLFVSSPRALNGFLVEESRSGKAQR